MAVSWCLSGGDGLAREPITMWFWGASPAYRKALDQALVDPFNASQADYRLIVEYRASVDKDVRVALMGGGGPDLIYTSGPSDVTPLARAGKLAPLEAYAARYGWNDRLLTPVLESCRQLGHLACIPLSLEADGMFYSKAVLRRYGWTVPRTGAEVEALMRAAQAKGLYASVTGNKGWQPVNVNYASIFLNQHLGQSRMACLMQGEGDWTSPRMLAAITDLDRWYQAGFLGGSDYFSLNFDLSLLMLHEGRAPFFFGPSMLFQWAPNYFRGEDADDLGFAPFPNLDPQTPYPFYDIGDAFSYSINASSKVKEGAAAVLDMMLTRRFSLQVAKIWPGYWVPPFRTFPADPDATGIVRTYDHALEAITDAINRGQYGYHVGTFFPPATRDVFVQDLEAVWVNEETPKQMLAKAKYRFDREHDPGLGKQALARDRSSCRGDREPAG